MTMEAVRRATKPGELPIESFFSLPRDPHVQSDIKVQLLSALKCNQLRGRLLQVFSSSQHH